MYPGLQLTMAITNRELVRGHSSNDWRLGDGESRMRNGTSESESIGDPLFHSWLFDLFVPLSTSLSSLFSSSSLLGSSDEHRLRDNSKDARGSLIYCRVRRLCPDSIHHQLQPISPRGLIWSAICFLIVQWKNKRPMASLRRPRPD